MSGKLESFWTKGRCSVLENPRTKPRLLAMTSLKLANLINIFGLALALWQNFQQKLTAAENQPPKSGN